MKQISISEYQNALLNGQNEMDQVHAISANYDGRKHQLSIINSVGDLMVIDVREHSVLKNHAHLDLSDPYVTPGGDGICFDKSDLSFGLPALLALQSHECQATQLHKPEQVKHIKLTQNQVAQLQASEPPPEPHY
jgi:hypothetical protein